ncbi:hypothetical protein [Caulobacter segnis]|uniref:hypothetical protein n=1 Tax=Caulobacter segnis TaxID=88688 RepID=UPI00285B9B03|nr:hypothetical protein [Caulobacter segnis]MDR6624950.1 hypothetical protein [Caulobacter segnis]
MPIPPDRREFLTALTSALVGSNNYVGGTARLADFGAKGDGKALDSEAINLALQASAKNGSTVLGTAGAIYRLNSVGTKFFVNPMGQKISKKYCIEVPDGASVDFRNSILLVDNNEDAIALSNKNTHALGDRISIRNVTVDGNFGDRTTPMIWFHGTTTSTFEDIGIKNCNYTGCVFTSVSDCKLDRIYATNITGQAIMLGGTPGQNISRCIIGKISASRIRKYRNPHQPGNPFLIGGIDVCISSITAEDCDAGIKISPGSNRVEIISAEFRRGNTQNSGIKIQGSPEHPCTRIKIHTVVSEDCFGSGIFIRHAHDCDMTSYTGINNGAGAKDADISISGEHIRIRSAISRGYRHGALYVAPASTSVHIGKLDIRRAGSNAFKPTIDIVEGSVEIDDLSIPRGNQIRHGSKASARIAHLRRT